ncbi:unnamed protein product [Dovyalis caffra]|uniref:Uncharacterized protein n=1 Tax=Dovyalis caffra TaxID=77055 RepID=A0AAV1S2R7_9ROSI|nr:unnamed protein product [Dovyalis caffra]
MGGDGPEERTIDLLPSFSEIRAADIPRDILYEDKDSEIPAMLYKMGQMLPRAAAVASSSWVQIDPDVVNQLHSRLHNFLEVGPLVLTSPIPSMSFFDDQSLNRRTVEAVWRIGVGIDGGMITKDGLSKAIKLILSTEEGEQMRKNIEHLQDLALDAVSNGSSTKNFETLLEVVTK